ncbi:MAG: phage tail protein [Actinomycetota bacterium]|nr:phage tail protein [Actinomycetota bacterium]
MRQAEIRRLLPSVFERTVDGGGPLAPLLDVMEHLHEPAERVLSELDAYLDPVRTRDDFVPMLARWLDLDWLMVENPEEALPSDFAPLASGTGRMRALAGAAASLSKLRGTVDGLTRFLEIATGVRGFSIYENVTADSATRPFHLLVSVPAPARGYEAMVRRIVEAQKPAYATYEIAADTDTEEEEVTDG